MNLGCQLIENLLSTSEGIAFLSKSQFFEELKEILDIELEKNPEMNPNRVLAEKDVAYYLCRDYFTIIGKISSIPQGVKLLQDFKIFNSLCSLVNSKREDIAQLIIKHMDYLHSNRQISQSARSILQEAMKGSKKIRYFTTLLIRKLLREYPKSDFLSLGIQLTLSQTNDDWEDLSKTSLQIIASTCRSPETLDILISLNPSVEQLEKQKEGRDLLLRMLSRESGFRYLQQNGWILPTLQSWKDKKIIEYVTGIEASLKRNLTLKKQTVDLSSNSHEQELVLSPHFYGEICKTKMGCQLIEQSGHLLEFMKILEDTNSDMLLRRSACWTLGQIISSETGYDFANGDFLISKFVNMAELDVSLSLRGMCLYILSESCKCSKSKRRLDALGWDCCCSGEDPDGSRGTIAFPRNPVRVFSIPEYIYKGSPCSKVLTMKKFLLQQNNEETSDIKNSITWKNIYQNLINMANPVTEKQAIRALSTYVNITNLFNLISFFVRLTIQFFF